MGVEVCGDGDGTVPKELAHDLHRDAGREAEASACVPKTVESKGRHIRARNQSFELSR